MAHLIGHRVVGLKRHRFWLVRPLIIGVLLAIRLDYVVVFANAANLSDAESEVATLFEKECVECHGSDVTNVSRTNLADFDDLYAGASQIPLYDCLNVDKSILLRKVNLGEMPKNSDKLKEEEISTIRKWIDAVCASDSGDDDVKIVRDSVPYEDPIKKAAYISLRNNCSSCHNSSSRNGGGGFYRILDLDYLAAGRGPKSYVNACQPDKSLLLRMIHTGSMPKGRPIVDNPDYTDDIAAITAWLNSLDPHAQNSNENLVTFDKLLELAVRDIATVDQEDRAFVRYLSLEAPFNAGLKGEDLQLLG